MHVVSVATKLTVNLSEGDLGWLLLDWLLGVFVAPTSLQ